MISDPPIRGGAAAAVLAGAMGEPARDGSPRSQTSKNLRSADSRSSPTTIPALVHPRRARVAWAHDWISDPSLIPAFQALPGASFIVNGATPAKNSALASAGAELRLVNGVSLLGKFDGEFAAHSHTYGGTGTVRYVW